jgi:CDGSH-type Zn-finger protein
MEKQSHTSAQIQVTKNGPYVVSGGLPLAEQHIVTNAEGDSLDWKEGEKFPAQTQYALCRCGHSSNRPFCDGTHAKVHFDGEETASREPYLDQAEVIEGPTMYITDAESLCAFARFCDPKGRIWNLVKETDNPEARKLVEFEAGHCPSGRLIAWDRKTGKSIEPKYQPSIGLVYDTEKKVDGPLWVRGGITVLAVDGTAYEVRNQCTLCRCGKSNNKPFCDGNHAA